MSRLVPEAAATGRRGGGGRQVHIKEIESTGTGRGGGGGVRQVHRKRRRQDGGSGGVVEIKDEGLKDGSRSREI